MGASSTRHGCFPTALIRTEPPCHPLVAEIIGAGSTMCTHNNCIYVFGGMDDERSETNNMWRWDLNTDDGFEPVVYRCPPPPPPS